MQSGVFYVQKSEIKNKGVYKCLPQISDKSLQCSFSLDQMEMALMNSPANLLHFCGTFFVATMKNDDGVTIL